MNIFILLIQTLYPCFRILNNKEVKYWQYLQWHILLSDCWSYHSCSCHCWCKIDPPHHDTVDCPGGQTSSLDPAPVCISSWQSRLQLPPTGWLSRTDSRNSRMTRLQSPGQDSQELSVQRISPPCNTCSCPDTQDARTEAVDHKTDCLNDVSGDLHI